MLVVGELACSCPLMTVGDVGSFVEKPCRIVEEVWRVHENGNGCNEDQWHVSVADRSLEEGQILPAEARIRID